MNSCPHCNEPVLEMAQKCRHCGNELDEATFFMNESEMLAEVAEIKKTMEAEKKLKTSLEVRFKVLAGVAILMLLSGGGLVALTQDALRGLGAALTVAGVIAVFLAIKARSKREALDE